jgi:CelD/BcsL family acetyltransferase involved in cellulose biosynthesis
MHVEILDHVPEALDDLAARSPDSTFYQSRTWLESLARAYPSMRLYCLVATGATGACGYLPYLSVKRGPFVAVWSLPFGTYGGPVTLDDEEARRALVEAYARTKERRGVHEVGLVDFNNRVAGGPFDYEHSSTHIVELEGSFDEIWNRNFEKSKRRQSRKAVREGLAVSEARALDEVAAYYRIYATRAERWGGRFRYPERLFADLFETGRGSVRLFLARRGDELLGGHLNFYFRNSVIAWNGVVRDTADGTQASTLLYTECFRHACQNGYRSYNLGSSLGKQSLIEYKESLGGAPYRYRTARWRSGLIRAAGTIRAMLSGR